MLPNKLQIGTLVLTSNILAAPMAGLSLPAFRKILLELGCALAYSEMVSAEGIVYDDKKTAHYYDNTIGARPFCVQLFTARPNFLYDAIRAIDSDAIDAFDINMGCPVKKVCRRGAGAALMRTPTRAAELIDAARGATAKPLTVKLRAGWDDTSINCVAMARMAEEHGADAVIIHPRTRAQVFKGHAQWDLIGAVKNAVTIPVIGNGDITSRDDALAMIAHTGCDGVMVGRAAYRNPWIFEELAGTRSLPPTPTERMQLALRYMEFLRTIYDEHKAVMAMRAFLSRYARGHAHVSKFLGKVYQTKSATVITQEIESFCFTA